LLALGIPIICPYDDYYGLLKNGYNCVMYHAPHEIRTILNELIYDDVRYEKLSENALDSSQQHYTSVIVGNLLKEVKEIDRENL